IDPGASALAGTRMDSDSLAPLARKSPMAGPLGFGPIHGPELVATRLTSKLAFCTWRAGTSPNPSCCHFSRLRTPSRRSSRGAYTKFATTVCITDLLPPGGKSGLDGGARKCAMVTSPSRQGLVYPCWGECAGSPGTERGQRGTRRWLQDRRRVLHYWRS